MRTIAEWLAGAVLALEKHTETPILDAQVLAAYVLEKPRPWILAHPEIELTTEQERRLYDDLKRLQNGAALPYVLGQREFYGLDFIVTPAVLIPRPETELLVEQALEWLRQRSTRRRVVDVGTGSGCIAVSLAAQVPDLRVIATDISGAALAVARQNAARHGVEGRLRFIQADLLELSSDEFSEYQPVTIDLITANLPYIPSGTLQTLDVYRTEPSLALDGGPDGLGLIRRLLSQAPVCLALGGLVLLEIEQSQGEAACSLAQTAFPHAQVSLLQDLAGFDRLVKIQT